MTCVEPLMTGLVGKSNLCTLSYAACLKVTRRWHSSSQGFDTVTNQESRLSCHQTKMLSLHYLSAPGLRGTKITYTTNLV